MRHPMSQSVAGASRVSGNHDGARFALIARVTQTQPASLAPLLLTLTGVLAACGDDDASTVETPETPAPHAGIDVDDPSACASCHGAIVSEWEQSMHASAHHESDPIYGAMRRLRMGREGDALARRCASCHGPRAVDAPESEVARTGVSCATCHALSGVGEGRGAAALRSGEALRGPHDVDADAPAPHGVGQAAPWITDGETLCLACHGEMHNAQDAPTCTTGTEYRASSGTERCTDCHMPEVQTAGGAISPRDTHRSHRFLGPHTLWEDPPSNDFMASAIGLQGELDGGDLQVHLENRSGHAVPSGFPGRVLLIRATGFDGAGEQVWQSEPTTLMRVYHDEGGAPTMPPYGTLARDTRLEPDETRELRWQVPATVSRAEVTALFGLLPPPAAAALQLDGPLTEARPFATLEVSR